MGTPPKKLRGEGMVGQRPVGGNRPVFAESVIAFTDNRVDDRLDGGRQRSLARRATGETRDRVDIAAGGIGTGHVRGLLHADAVFVLVEVLGEAGGARGLTHQIASITGAGHGALDCGARVDRERGMAGGQR